MPWRFGTGGRRTDGVLGAQNARLETWCFALLDSVVCPTWAWFGVSFVWLFWASEGGMDWGSFGLSVFLLVLLFSVIDVFTTDVSMSKSDCRGPEWLSCLPFLTCRGQLPE